MLSLFPKKGSDDSKKPSQSFDLDAFISSVIPAQEEDFSLQREDSSNNKPETDRLEHVPSKSAQRLMKEVKKTFEDRTIPKGVQKASKKLAQTFSSLMESASEPKKTQVPKPQQYIREPQKVERKIRLDTKDPKPPRNIESQGAKSGNGGQNSLKKSQPKSSVESKKSYNSPPQQKAGSSRPRQEEGSASKSTKSKDVKGFEKHRASQGSKLADENTYDPLDFGMNSLKLDKGISQQEEPEENSNVSYEQYDPLQVIWKKSSDKPLSPKNDEANILGKRPMPIEETPSKYENEITKKLKM